MSGPRETDSASKGMASFVGFVGLTVSDEDIAGVHAWYESMRQHVNVIRRAASDLPAEIEPRSLSLLLVFSNQTESHG